MNKIRKFFRWFFVVSLMGLCIGFIVLLFTFQEPSNETESVAWRFWDGKEITVLDIAKEYRTYMWLETEAEAWCEAHQLPQTKTQELIKQFQGAKVKLR